MNTQSPLQQTPPHTTNPLFRQPSYPRISNPPSPAPIPIPTSSLNPLLSQNLCPDPQLPIQSTMSNPTSLPPSLDLITPSLRFGTTLARNGNGSALHLCAQYSFVFQADVEGGAAGDGDGAEGGGAQDDGGGVGHSFGGKKGVSRFEGLSLQKIRSLQSLCWSTVRRWMMCSGSIECCYATCNISVISTVAVYTRAKGVFCFPRPHIGFFPREVVGAFPFWAIGLVRR